MKRINNGIVFSNDIYRILSGKNALDYNYQEIWKSSGESINSGRI